MAILSRVSAKQPLRKTRILGKERFIREESVIYLFRLFVQSFSKIRSLLPSCNKSSWPRIPLSIGIQQIQSPILSMKTLLILAERRSHISFMSDV